MSNQEVTTEKPTTTDRAHHEYSPSTLQAREACPGYKGESTTNQAAETGTYLHDCVEKFLTTGVLDAGLDDEQINVVESCAAFVREKQLELGEGTELIMEEYLPIDDAETTAGYLDVGLVNRATRKAAIIDWKMGQNPVEQTSNNLQGMAYRLGMLRRFEGAFDTCEVTFVMPFQGDTGLVDQHTFGPESVDDHYLRIVTIVARAKDATADFKSGEILKTWPQKLKATNGTCLFCARKADCPALHALVLDAGKKYDPLVVPDVINPMLIKDAKAAGQALKFFAVMEALSKAYRAKATEKAVTDEVWVPEGFMITTMTTRSIIDNQKFLETVRPLLTEEELIKAIKFTIGPVEEAVKAKAPRGKKTEAVTELGELLKMNGATQESEPIIQLRQKRGKAKDESVPTLT